MAHDVASPSTAGPADDRGAGHLLVALMDRRARVLLLIVLVAIPSLVFVGVLAMGVHVGWIR